MKPKVTDALHEGQIRVFKSGKKVAMLMVVGIWAERRNEKNPSSPIDIHLTAASPFNHTTVSNGKGDRYHKNAFGKLRAILAEQGRWPFGEES